MADAADLYFDAILHDNNIPTTKIGLDVTDSLMIL